MSDRCARAKLTFLLTKKENEVLNELAKKHAQTKTYVLRQALRLYQIAQARGERGESLCFIDADGKRTDMIFGLDVAE